LPCRIQASGKSFRSICDSPAPPVKKLLPALGQQMLGSPAPLVAVLAQRFVILCEASDQGFHGLELSLDRADAREE
jgi:hypothetical protein